MKCTFCPIVPGLRAVSLLTILSMLLIGCNFPSEKSTSERIVVKIDEAGYNDSINSSRNKKHIEFLDSTISRFNKQERDSFHGFNYFEPDIRYRVEAQFVLDTTKSILKVNKEEIFFQMSKTRNQLFC